MEERAKIFGFSLETPERIRHLKRVAKLANEMTEGAYGEMMTSNPAKQNAFGFGGGETYGMKVFLANKGITHCEFVGRSAHTSNHANQLWFRT